VIFNNKVYNVLKFIALILLPSLGTFYFAIAEVWNLPFAEEIVGSIAAIDVFLGVLLGISTANYKKQATQNMYIQSSLSGEDLIPPPTKASTGYDIAKWIAQILIPAIATLYFALATIWHLPYGEEVVGFLTAVDALLGTVLGISTAQYNKEVTAS
jgi:hypothetical protein